MPMTKTIRVAAAAYPLSYLNSLDDYRTKLTRWVDDAADCDLLLFPEYGALELATLGGPEIAGDLKRALQEAARHKNALRELHEELARNYQCYLLAGSIPYFVDEKIYNRALLFGPDGLIGHQDKQIITPTEIAIWDLSSNPGLQIFDTPIGRLGVLICYDSEFPLLARQLAEREVEILLVPSYTNSLAGYHRVRIGAMARALESQCVVLHAPLIGASSWNQTIGDAQGAAAIYAPPDGFWPETGIISIGELNTPGWTKAEFNRTQVAKSRRSGTVLTFAHWPLSEGIKCTSD